MADTGRKPHFKTPEELEAKWQEFVKECEQTGKWINQDKFCLRYGYYCNLFNEYAKKPAFSGTLGMIEKECKNHLLEKGLTGDYNSNIVKLIASANYGMSEKNIIAGDKENPLELSITTIRQTILDDLNKVKSDKAAKDKVKRGKKY
jgi:hypothetical protein